VSPFELDFGGVVKGQKSTNRYYIRYDSEAILQLTRKESQQAYLQVSLKPLTSEDIRQTLSQCKMIGMPNCFNRFILDAKFTGTIYNQEQICNKDINISLLVLPAQQIINHKYVLWV
jgi:hypothetical protein